MSLKQRLGLFIAIGGRFGLAALFIVWANLLPLSDRVTRWISHADQAAEDGTFDEAQRTYGQVLTRLGSQPIVYERLFQISLTAKRYAEAQIYLFALADLDGWTTERRSQLAMLLEYQGDIEQANTLLAFAPDSFQDTRTLRRLAEQQIASQDWEQAGQTLEQLVALEPDDVQALYWLGVLLAPQNQDFAAVYLNQAAANPGWTVRARTILAALESYQQFSLTDAHTTLGLALVNLAEWGFAERVLEMALQVNSVNPTARGYLGYVRDQSGRDGLPDIEAALAISPNDPVLYYLLGQHWRQLSKQSEAHSAFMQAYWLAPENPALAAEVGISLQNLSDLPEAEQWFRRAMTLAPAEVRWQSMLAAFYADTGFKLEEGGLAFIEQTQQLAPNDSDLRASLGWAYYQLNNIENAYSELSTAVGLDPANVRSRYYFGVVLERRSEPQGAADSYWFVVQEAGPDSQFGILAARALQRLGYATP
ncbi:MAG: tetratricopeptide repeat protein [Chloroflexi bacterium]|nr:tetratricopeptide repeat protein [Chloroflexota bacterium]